MKFFKFLWNPIETSWYPIQTLGVREFRWCLNEANTNGIPRNSLKRRSDHHWNSYKSSWNPHKKKPWNHLKPSEAAWSRTLAIVMELIRNSSKPFSLKPLESTWNTLNSLKRSGTPQTTVNSFETSYRSPKTSWNPLIRLLLNSLNSLDQQKLHWNVQHETSLKFLKPHWNSFKSPGNVWYSMTLPEVSLQTTRNPPTTAWNSYETLPGILQTLWSFWSRQTPMEPLKLSGSCQETPPNPLKSQRKPQKRSGPPKKKTLNLTDTSLKTPLKHLWTFWNIHKRPITTWNPIGK